MPKPPGEEVYDVVGYCLVDEKHPKIRTGVVIGVPDCRTCSLAITICTDCPEEDCPRFSACQSKHGVEYCDECPLFGTDRCEYPKVCCWECEKIYECLDWFNDSVDPQFWKDVFNCTYEEFKEAVKRLRKRLGVEK